MSTGADQAQTCSVQPFGACSVSVCSIPVPTFASAGTIDLTGLSLAVTLSPRADDRYDDFIARQLLSTGGESITITGTGAEVPAFSINVTAPSRPSITLPTKPLDFGPLVIDRAQDFALTWTGGAPGNLRVQLIRDRTVLSCSFDASAGSAQIPSAALSALTAGTGTGDAVASFYAHGMDVDSVDIADWRVYGEALFWAVWAADSSMCQAVVTL